MTSNVQTVKTMNIGFYQGIELDVRIAATNLVSQAEQLFEQSNKPLSLLKYSEINASYTDKEKKT